MFDEVKKTEWIITNLLCPSCGAEIEFFDDGKKMLCMECNEEYIRDGVMFNMLTPSLRNSFNIVDTDNVSDHPYDPLSRRIIHRQKMVLDCGSGKKSEPFKNVVQMDIVPYPYVDVLGVNQKIPFKDDSFDAIISLNVLEHVDNPFDCAREILRVLKPGGEIYLNVPFLHREHGYPHHYFGMTRMGAQKLFGDKVEILDHYVPLSGHPIFALYLMLDSYLKGLPNHEAEYFKKMTVKDILAKPPKSWLSNEIVTKLDKNARWRIATTTTLIMRKKVKRKRDETSS